MIVKCNSSLNITKVQNVIEINDICKSNMRKLNDFDLFN